MAMIADENSESESDTEEPPLEKTTINTDYKIITSLEEPPTDLEFKPLPDNLEYVFLEEPSFLPENTTSYGIENLLGYLVETMIEDFDNIAFGQNVTMAVSEHFLHTKPSIVSDRGNIIRQTASFSVKWLPLMANSFAVSRIVIAEPGVRATTQSTAYIGSGNGSTSSADASKGEIVWVSLPENCTAECGVKCGALDGKYGTQKKLGVRMELMLNLTKSLILRISAVHNWISSSKPVSNSSY
nr:reverse transcriptase domain-containing protein [Tanacetum cinerariifolium]